jgi:hypothetical protein
MMRRRPCSISPIPDHQQPAAGGFISSFLIKFAQAQFASWREFKPSSDLDADGGFFISSREVQWQRL